VFTGICRWVWLLGVDAGEEPVEDGDEVLLVAFGGVVALANEDGDELGSGGEVDAGLTDGLEGAVELGGSGAVAVAEEPALHLEPEPPHLLAFGRSWQLDRGGGVEGFDLFGDGEVFVGHLAVGDAGVDQGHPQRPVTQQGGDRFEAHPSVDRLGGQRVSQGVGVDVADPGGPPDACTNQLEIAVDHRVAELDPPR
jgi:hypothetical protein